MKYPREPKTELSFAGEKLTRGRHKIHPYPAMLHPLLVDYLLGKYSKDNDKVFDPFCGSGVTLLQSALRGNVSYGFDINPLALMIAKAKTRKYDISQLTKEYYNLRDSILTHKKDIDIPTINNIEYWYTPEVINDLGRIRYRLIHDKYINKDFFLAAFAYICRDQSLTRNGEFKRYRIKIEKIKDHPNKVFEKYFFHIENMIEIFTQSNNIKHSGQPILHNSENSVPPEIAYDLVITSPPYGDSRTTVAYGEFSSFGSEWVKDLNSVGEVDYRVDSECLGKKGVINDEIFNHQELTEIYNKIKNEDKKRADEVLHFFNGYYNSIKNISKNLKKGGIACFVVGNRTVKGHQIPMDQITASFFEDFGLKTEHIFIRDILNKVMPSQNSPTNKTGIKKTTMMNEFVIILRKAK